MENQHRRITGYRELDQTEIDLMNKVKALGPVVEEVLNEIGAHINAQAAIASSEEDTTHIDNATPARFLALATTELQTGLMYATRAVAQPEFF